jgi:hypothetical protein
VITFEFWSTAWPPNVNGFFYSRQGCSTFDFSNDRFLKQQTSTFKLTKLKLFTIPKLKCTQFAHILRKILHEVQKCIHVFNEKETQNQINIKKFPTWCKFPFLNFEQVQTTQC